MKNNDRFEKQRRNIDFMSRHFNKRMTILILHFLNFDALEI